MFRLPSSKKFFIATIFNFAASISSFAVVQVFLVAYENLIFDVFLLNFQEFYCQPNFRGCSSGMDVPSVVPPLANVCCSQSGGYVENVPHFKRECSECTTNIHSRLRSCSCYLVQILTDQFHESPWE